MYCLPMLSAAAGRVSIHSLLTCAFLLFVSLLPNECAGQSYKSLCIQGNNKYQAASHHRIEVSVEPAESGGFGTHLCRAALEWDKQSLVVAQDAVEVDLDLFDVDLEGLGPVAAFQIKESADDCCLVYQIYSLEKPVRLLRTIRSGTFHGADTDLDGRVEIWAEDRASIDGLEGLNQDAIRYPPSYVLRFEHGRLLDASRAFQEYFDQIIAAVRREMNPDDLRAFHQSSGSLQYSIGRIDEWRKLRSIRVQVLEIVWAYFYSGRETEAWKELDAMWPAEDAARMQASLRKARAGGILTQIDGISSLPPAKKRSQVFDDPVETQHGISAAIIEMGTHIESRPAPVFDRSEVKEAQPIQMWRPMPADLNKVVAGEEWLDLLIDSAGKVRLVKWTERKTPPDEELLSYALAWKFIPAHRHGKSVASRLRFAVFPKR
jgi:hypothetical protein